MADISQLVIEFVYGSVVAAKKALEDAGVAAEGAGTKVDELGKKTEDHGKKTEHASESTKKLTLANLSLADAFKALATSYAVMKVADWVKDATMLAARYETMGIVMKVAGNNAGYSMAQMEKYSRALEKSGISMLEARNVLTQLASAQVDLTRAQELANVAKDAAVIGDVNSSQALARMTHAIKANSVEILTSLGLQVNFDAAYRKLEKSLGVARDGLNETQKVIARTNAVVEAGVPIMGIYDSAMMTAGKQMTSLKRYWEDFMIKAGTAFLPTLAEGVFMLTSFLKLLNERADSLGKDGSIRSAGELMKTAFIEIARGAMIVLALLGGQIERIGIAANTMSKYWAAIKGIDWGSLDSIKGGIDALKRAKAEDTKETLLSMSATNKLVAQLQDQGSYTDAVKAKMKGKTEEEILAMQATAKAAGEVQKYNEQAAGTVAALNKKTDALGRTKREQTLYDAALKISAGMSVENANAIWQAAVKLADAEDKKAAASKKGTSEAEKFKKATDASVKAGWEYIGSLKKETEELGLNAIQKKMHEAALQAEKVPLGEQRTLIMAAALAWAYETQAMDANKEMLEQVTKGKLRVILAVEEYNQSLKNAQASENEAYAADVRAYAQAYKLVDALHDIELAAMGAKAESIEMAAAMSDVMGEADQRLLDQANTIRARMVLKRDTWAKEDADKEQAELDKAFKNEQKELDKSLKTTSGKRGKEAESIGGMLEQALTDSLFRAAEAGKGFFETLKQSLMGIFNNMILKPMIQIGVSGLMGMLGMGEAGGGSGIMGMMNGASSAYNALSGKNPFINKIGSWLGLGGSAGLAGSSAATFGSLTGSSLLTGSGLAGGVAPAVGGGTFGSLTGSALLEGGGLAAGVPTVATAATAVAPATGIAAAIPYIGWAVAIGGLLISLFGGKGGGPKSGGSYSTNTERLFTPDTADAEVQTLGKTIGGTITDYMKVFGSPNPIVGGPTSSVQFGLGFDTDPEGKAGSRIASFVQNREGKYSYDNTAGKAVGDSPAEIQAALADEGKRVLLAALQASDVEQGWIDVFNRLDPATASIDQIDALMATAEAIWQVGEDAKKLPGVMGLLATSSVAARESVLTLVGGLDQLRALQQSYMQGFFTPTEQLDQMRVNIRTTFKNIGLDFEALMANPKGPILAFRDLVENLYEKNPDGTPKLNAQGQRTIPVENAASFAGLMAANPELLAFANATNQVSQATNGAVPKILSAAEAMAALNTTPTSANANNNMGAFTPMPSDLGGEGVIAPGSTPLTDAQKAIADVRREAGRLPGVMGAVANSSDAAVESLLNMVGGIDALRTKQQSYYENFLTPQQQITNTQANLASDFEDAGLNLADFMNDPAGPIAAFAAFTEGLRDGSGQISDANLEIYGSMMNLQGPYLDYVHLLEQHGATVTGAIPSLAEYTRLEAARQTQIDDLNKSINANVETMTDLDNGMKAAKPVLEGVVESTGQYLTRLANNITTLEQALAKAVETSEPTNMDKLNRLLTSRTTFRQANEDTDNVIADQTLQGFTNRGDSAGAVAFLKEWENNLWGGLGESLNQSGDIAKIREIFLRRIGIEASAAQTESEKVAQSVYNSAVKAQNLEKQGRADQITGLKNMLALAKQLKSQSESILNAVSQLRSGDLSSLNPYDKLAEARTNFDTMMIKARSTNPEDAQFGIANAVASGTNYIRMQREFSASSGDTPDVFKRVTGELEALGLGLGNLETPEISRQIAALEAISDPVIEMKTAVVDFTPQAITGLTNIKTALLNGLGYLDTNIPGATKNVQTELEGMRQDLKDEYGKALLRWQALDADTKAMKANLTAITTNTGNTATGVREAASVPAVTK